MCNPNFRADFHTHLYKEEAERVHSWFGKARLHQVHVRLVGFMCKVNTASPNDFPLRLFSLPIYFAW